ncbi:MAG: hypothetical protein ACOYL5_20265 [Phototrophicaceae bacterium]
MQSPYPTLMNHDTGEQITFLQTATATNGLRLKLDLFMPAGKNGVPAHIHHLQSHVTQLNTIARATQVSPLQTPIL